MQKQKNKKQSYLLKDIKINEQKCQHCETINNIAVYSPLALYDCQKTFISYVLQCLQSNQNALIQSPTGTGKTLSLLCSTISWVYSQQSKSKKQHRIIYTSRTHSQLKQVISELNKTGFDLKMAILASRQHTCINPQLKELPNQSKELECRLKTTSNFTKNNKQSNLIKHQFCKYYHHEDYYEKMENRGKIMDLQQVVQRGTLQGYCPYFYEKSTKNTANIIFMPYNYLFDEKIMGSQEEGTKIISDSIIILDQGHNIPSVCENSKQYSINLSILERSLHQMSQLRQLKLRESKKSVEQQTMKSTANDIQLHSCYITAVHTHMQSLDLPPDESGILMSIMQFTHFLQNGTKECQSGIISKNIQKLYISSQNIRVDVLYRPFWPVNSWLKLVQILYELFRNQNKQNIQSQNSYYKVQVSYQGSDIRLNVICLDPKSGFQKIMVHKPKCVILTSGTLSPLNSWPLELQAAFAKPQACQHIMSKEQVNACILTEGPNKVRLNFNYDNRQNKGLYKEFGQILYDITSKIKNGIIVLFPSYAVLEKAKQELGSNGYLGRIYSLKNVFFEKKNSANFKQDLNNYLTEAIKPKGAIMFALAKGKVSEGLDFSHQKCRAIVMAGVPYPASKDLKIVSKMAYLDQKSKVTKTMNGNQWYICQTIRCINQSIGRIIRNQEDHGSIFLLDERFKKTDIMNQISTWAKQCMKIYNNYEDFTFKMNLFEQFQSQKHNKIQQQNNAFQSIMGTRINKDGSLSKVHKFDPVSLNYTQNLRNVIKKEEKQNKSVDPQKEQQKIQQKFAQEKQQVQEQIQNEKTSRQKLIFTKKFTKKTPQFIKKQCPVCRLQKKLIGNTECTHQVCVDCWDIWLKKDLRCPLCRARVREKYLNK